MGTGVTIGGTRETASVIPSKHGVNTKMPPRKGKETLHLNNVFNARTYGLLTEMRGVGGEA